MKSCHKRKKTNYLTKLLSKQGILFHIAGIIAIIWFLIRVVPRPDRIRYPCQQMGISVAFGYITFWSLLWSSLFHGLCHLTKKLKNKTIVVAPAILVSLIIIFSVSSNVFADNYVIKKDEEVEISSIWDPIPKEPIGTPQGTNPGRVVWVWNPDATEEELIGYWWYKENNNQEVIDQMYLDGLQQLAGVDNDYDAWNILFHYFNIEHGKGDVGYQPGEKIAIKINMNNGYNDPYTSEYDDVDANPYVVKALLQQLRDVVGVAEEDITVYDASRKLMNWFYYRVYYEEYPADPLVPEFPDVHYVDMDGGAEGREQVVASDERVYFAAGSCAYRTLPTVVTEADYMINMPITKRHVGERVTLAGKNWFGTWMEYVYPIHNYHTMGYSQMGNPAPQADLVAHERLGGNTLLLIGDGTYACRYGNFDISKFEMYPFNGDWMSSLFFSQDSVALDSVMFDFFMVEGTGGGPSEGAQNYLHQQAEPPEDLYDPENDGEYVSESLGVHEHWDTDENIFSLDRYSGPSNDGIDYIAVSGGILLADADGPYYGAVNEPIQFNGFATGGSPPYQYLWEFGDGHTSDDKHPTHNYENSGIYSLTLTVTDADQSVATDDTTATINTPPNKPTITGTTSGKPGVGYIYGFTSTDSDDDDVSYYIKWGDGDATDWTAFQASGPPGYSDGHAWDEQGTYTIEAKAKDIHGAVSEWAELTVTMPRNRATSNSLFLRFLEQFPLLERLLYLIE